MVPLWYSFDVVKKRVEEGGWTHEVTQRELPSSVLELDFTDDASVQRAVDLWSCERNP
jgi:hypothetical protein